MAVTLLGPDTGSSRYTASLVTAGDVRFVRCDPDFSDEVTLRRSLDGADAVVLLGYVAPTSSSAAQSLLDELAGNVAPVVRILRAADGGVRHAVFASSVAVYGAPARVPVRETDPTGPRTPYAIAKLTAELAVRAACAAQGMTVSVLRYATVFGAGEPLGRAVSTFVREALARKPLVIEGDGLDEQDYVNIADVVVATLAALQHRAAGVYNVGTGIGTTTLDLARLISDLADTKAPPVCRTWRRPENADVRIVCDTALASADLGFLARRPLVDGIREEIGWLKAQRSGTPDPLLAASA